MAFCLGSIIGLEPNFHLGPEPNFQKWPFIKMWCLNFLWNRYKNSVSDKYTWKKAT